MDPYQRSVRRLKRLEQKFARFGYPHPRCAICGEDRVVMLERHHLAGAANSAFSVPLCANHHHLLSDAQEDLLPDLRRRDEARSPLLKAAAMADGAAAFFEPFAAQQRQWATYFTELDRHLTTKFGPDWWRQNPKEVPK
jgi:hypothetical protein